MLLGVLQLGVGSPSPPKMTGDAHALVFHQPTAAEMPAALNEFITPYRDGGGTTDGKD